LISRWLFALKPSMMLLFSGYRLLRGMAAEERPE